MPRMSFRTFEGEALRQEDTEKCRFAVDRTAAEADVETRAVEPPSASIAADDSDVRGGRGRRVQECVRGVSSCRVLQREGWVLWRCLPGREYCFSRRRAERCERRRVVPGSRGVCVVGSGCAGCEDAAGEPCGRRF